jgi:hypothetical protein
MLIYFVFLKERIIMTKNKLAASTALILLLSSNSAFAVSDNDIAELKTEIQLMKKGYEGRIAELEKKLDKLEKEKKTALAVQTKSAEIVPQSVEVTPAQNQQPVVAASAGGNDNSFNPAIGVILNGRYSNYSTNDSNLKGFGIGDEGTRGTEGFSLGESEINFSANADDKFAGNLTASIAPENGEDKLSVEEAYLKTLPGSGLPTGMTVKAGRSLWKFGYLNEHHAHTDDFADRPLPYRAFLNNAFNDDGAEVSYVLPTDFYSEIGGGAFRGDSFPGSSSTGEGAGSYSSYARVGGDFTTNQSWQIGASWLHTHTPGRLTNGDTLTFVGDNNLYAADARYTWAPTGNENEKEVTLQAEYLFRNEDGTYNDINAITGNVPFSGHESGWYAQGTYKFLPAWRVGARYSELQSPNIPVGLIGSQLDSRDQNPTTYSLMTDWSNSEFSRVRLQYNLEDLSDGTKDNQVILQYIMSLGAHGAHQY